MAVDTPEAALASKVASATTTRSFRPERNPSLATMPAALSDVAGLPRLLEALRDNGFSAGEVERIAWGNWRRVLAAAWGAG